MRNNNVSQVLRIISTIFLLMNAHNNATPPALLNCGNTCFLNASVQALLNIPAFTSILYGSNASTLFPLATNPTAHYFTQLVQQYLDGTHTFSCTQGPLKKLGDSAYNEFFEAQVCSQQDAGEFIIRFLDSCTSHAITDKEAVVLNSALAQLQEQLKQNPQSVLLQQKIQQTRIKQLFHNIYVSRISCPAHEAPTTPLLETDTAENGPGVLTVPALDAQQTPLTDLASCLAVYFKPELLDAYKDNSGHVRTDCIKQLFFLTTPPYLCINVNRYTYTALARQKVNHAIAIPLELDVSPWVRPLHPALASTSSKAASHYALSSVVVQGGGLSGGHYWAYVKKEQVWYRCDDSTITRVGTELSADAITEINGSPTGPTGYFFIYKRQEALLPEKPIRNPRSSTNVLTESLTQLTQKLSALATTIS